MRLYTSELVKKYIARIGTACYRTEDVTIEDIHIGKSDDITLLTSLTITETKLQVAQPFYILEESFLIDTPSKCE